MDENKDVEAGINILPGVDLALWLRIIVLLALAVVAVGITLTVS
jgi:biopolymer transport protein ExbD